MESAGVVTMVIVQLKLTNYDIEDRLEMGIHHRSKM